MCSVGRGRWECAGCGPVVKLNVNHFCGKYCRVLLFMIIVVIKYLLFRVLCGDVWHGSGFITTQGSCFCKSGSWERLSRHKSPKPKPWLLTVFSPGSRSPSGHYTSCRAPARWHVTPHTWHVTRDNSVTVIRAVMKPMAGGWGWPLFDRGITLIPAHQRSINQTEGSCWNETNVILCAVWGQ